MNVHERAAQIWPVLRLAAANRQTLSYGQLASLIGVPQPALGQLLEPIQSLCLGRSLPPLTALVIGRDTGLPGVGFVAAADVPAAQASVYRKDWSEIGCPSPDEFSEAVRLLPSNGVRSATPSAGSDV